MLAPHVFVDQEAAEKRPEQDWAVTLKADPSVAFVGQISPMPKGPQPPITVPSLTETHVSKMLACEGHFI